MSTLAGDDVADGRRSLQRGSHSVPSSLTPRTLCPRQARTSDCCAISGWCLHPWAWSPYSLCGSASVRAPRKRFRPRYAGICPESGADEQPVCNDVSNCGIAVCACAQWRAACSRARVNKCEEACTALKMSDNDVIACGERNAVYVARRGRPAPCDASCIFAHRARVRALRCPQARGAGRPGRG